MKDFSGLWSGNCLVGEGQVSAHGPTDGMLGWEMAAA